MLQLPVMGADAIAAMSADVAVDRRLLELEFSKASQNLRRIAQRGDHEETEKAWRRWMCALVPTLG
jgi:hypothetical protein